jgi:hypothetical protein
MYMQWLHNQLTRVANARSKDCICNTKESALMLNGGRCDAAEHRIVEKASFQE